MDNVLDMLDGDNKPFANGNSGYNAGGNKGDDKFDYWGNPEVNPIKADINAFKKSGKSFTVALFGGDKGIPVDVEEKIFEVAKALIVKGYRFRYGDNGENALLNKLAGIDATKTDVFLAWKTFNRNAPAEIKALSSFMIRANGKGYGVAANSHKAFKKLPNAVRAILAKDVHMLVGKDLTDPVDVMLVYTLDGSEALGKGIDYKQTGNVTFYLKVANDANIPVFNFKKADAVSRLVEFTKANS